jgi:antitoxin component YwqK of YwqJK toxin-antitoxin module
MRALLILILSFCFTLNVLGQTLPDSLGFTDKAEAKNLMVNGLKEGKWFEHLDGGLKVITDTSFYKTIIDSNGRSNPYRTCFYSLSIYKAGKHNGITRWYLLDWTLWCEYPYKDDKVNGVYKGYYHNGQVEWETSLINDIMDGAAIEYYTNGKKKRKLIYKKGKKQSTKDFDENGIEIINGIFKDFNEAGELITEITIKNGKEKKTKYHYYNINRNEIK